MLIESLVPDKPEDIAPPAWVNQTNVSFRAWIAMIEIFDAKQESILRSNAREGLNAKKDYQISQREIATRAGCNPSTLHNRRFSHEFRTMLATLNEELKEIRDKRKAALQKVGMKDRRKTEIVDELKRRSRELEDLRNRNTKEVVEEIFKKLPLRTRRALMLE